MSSLTSRPSRTSRSLGATLVLAMVGVALGTGCVAKPDVNLQALNYAGDYGRAREHAAARIYVPKDKRQAPDREYMLSRMRFALAAMNDGYCVDDPVFTEVYETLSKHGVNKDKKVVAVVFNEDLKLWKGEPFEQAIMLSYLSMYHAMQGSWDNARAAASSSQFYLTDFGTTKEGKRRTNEDLVKEAAAAKNEEEFFNSYTSRETDFCLGILLDAIANQQIGRKDEAASKFNAVQKLRPDLQPLVAELAKGDYTDLLVVSWGQGPQKIGTGMDNAIASWKPQMEGSDEPLIVKVGGGTAKSYPLVCDVNRMAQDHMWNNLQDIRKAKSYIGTALVAGGGIVAAKGLQNRDTGTAVAGLAIALVGAGLKAGAHADTRYCDVMPQRFYIVPVKADRKGAGSVDLQIDGRPASRLLLTGLTPPAKGKPASLRYVNLVTKAPATPQWAASGKVCYNSDTCITEVEKPWPYILGGDCVRRPTQAALDYYQKNGHLTDMTLAELQDLYRQEGIVFDGTNVLRTRHVLEGGSSLAAPLPGTTGFARLFGQRHPSYVPKSPPVRQLAGRMKGGPAAPTGAVASR